MKKKARSMSTQTAKAGDAVVIYGSNSFDRDVVKYTNAKALITYIRERDHEHNDIATNEEYMHMIVSRIKDAYEDVNLPYHDEEAFVAALFKLGLFDKTTLN